MQVIDKAITPDGIEIELRDLSGEHKLPDYNGMEIVFHTIACSLISYAAGSFSSSAIFFNTTAFVSRLILQL